MFLITFHFDPQTFIHVKAICHFHYEFLFGLYRVGTGYKAFVKIIDIVALLIQVAGVTVPIFIHTMNYGEYKWLVSDDKEVSTFRTTNSSYCTSPNHQLFILY